MRKLDIPESTVYSSVELLTIEGCEQLFRYRLRAEEEGRTPDEKHPVHPGIVVAMVIEQMNISQADFARILGVSKALLNQVLHGGRSITLQMALSVEMVTEIPAHVLMRMQADYSLHEARMSILKANKEHIEEEHQQRMAEVAENFERFIKMLAQPYHGNTAAWWQSHQAYYPPRISEIADHIKGEIKYRQEHKKFETK